MNDKHKQLDWMITQAKTGRMNRREFIGRTTALGRVGGAGLGAVLQIGGGAGSQKGRRDPRRHAGRGIDQQP
jgi:peptide/nickel transport system substrate-binding protein